MITQWAGTSNTVRLVFSVYGNWWNSKDESCRDFHAETEELQAMVHVIVSVHADTKPIKAWMISQFIYDSLTFSCMEYRSTIAARNGGAEGFPLAGTKNSLTIPLPKPWISSFLASNWSHFSDNKAWSLKLPSRFHTCTCPQLEVTNFVHKRVITLDLGPSRAPSVSEWYQILMAHQHQKAHTVPKQV